MTTSALELYDNDDLGLDDVESFSSFKTTKIRLNNLLKSPFMSTTLKSTSKVKKSTPPPPEPPGISDVPMPPGDEGPENGVSLTKPSDNSERFAAANTAAAAAVSTGSIGKVEEETKASKPQTSSPEAKRKNESSGRSHGRRSRSRSPPSRRRRKSRSRSRSPLRSHGFRHFDNRKEGRGRYVVGRYAKDYKRRDEGKRDRSPRRGPSPPTRRDPSPPRREPSPPRRESSPSRFHSERHSGTPPRPGVAYPPPGNWDHPPPPGYAPRGNPRVDWVPNAQPGAPSPAATWDPTVYAETPEQVALKLAVEKEAQQQKQAFIDQRMGYVSKREHLLGELDLLKAQRRDLASCKEPEAIKFNEENIKLQEEIVRKIKSVDNVLDMLTGLIGDGLQIVDIKKDSRSGSPKKESKKKRSESDSESSSSDEESKKKEKKKKKKKTAEKSENSATKLKKAGKFNYTFFDPELHWCRPCKKFPPTAKEYLMHLHSREHRQVIQEQNLAQYPWHNEEEKEPEVVQPGLPNKRVPIKGLQFFVPSSAWYCKLCKTWIGDLHCSSMHLKSEEHNKKYQGFIEKHPLWESTWESYRAQALATGGRGEDLKRKLEEQLEMIKKQEEMAAIVAAANELPPTDLLMPLTINTKKRDSEKKEAKKKKKKRYSSSSSSSSSSSDDEKRSSKKKKKKAKEQPVLKVPIPEKSRWEKEEEEPIEPTQTSPTDPYFDMKINKMRAYRHSSDRSKQMEGDKGSLSPKRRFVDPKLPRIPPPSMPVTKREDTLPKVPDKHTLLLPETAMFKSPQSSPFPPFKAAPEDNESRFEKQAAALKKRPPPALPKTKFPIIGRMPFVRKKPEPAREDSKRDQDVETPDPTPPPPPMIGKKPQPPKPPAQPPILTNKTKLEAAKEILSKSQSILQKRHPEPKPVDPVAMEEDMDIVKQNESSPPPYPPLPPRFTPPVLPPEVTKNLGKKTVAIPLPSDLQEALNIIYPQDSPNAVNPPLPPPLPVSAPKETKSSRANRMDTPSPPPAPNVKQNDFHDFASEIPVPPSPPNSFELFSLDKNNQRTFGDDDDDEMAMLGIDKADMAALRF